MELRILLIEYLKPYKFEVFFLVLFLIIPSIALLIFLSNKLERFFFFFLNWSTSRAATIENISFTDNEEFFKGTVYNSNVHLGDLIALVFLFTGVLKREFRRYYTLIPEGTIPLLIHIAFSCASIVNASEYTIDRSYFAVTLYVRQFIFFYCFANYLRIPMRREYQLKSFFYIAVYTAIVALQQRYIGGLHRLGADFAHPNQMVFYLVPTFTLFTVILFNSQDNGYNKKVAIIAILAVTVSCLMSMSRGFIVHIITSMLTILALDLSFKFNLRKPFIIIGCMFLLAIASMKAWDTWYFRIFHNANPVGTAQRKAYYVIGWEVFKKYKYFGIGINQFGSNAYTIDVLEKALEYDVVKRDKMVLEFIAKFKRDSLLRSTSEISPRYWFSGGNPESYYVLHFAETGLLGFFGTVFCQLFFILSAFRSVLYFRRRNMFFYSLSVGLVGVQNGMYAQSTFEYILRQENPMYLQAIIFAMVSSVASVRRSKKFDSSGADIVLEGESKAEVPPPIPNLNS